MAAVVELESSSPPPAGRRKSRKSSKNDAGVDTGPANVPEVTTDSEAAPRQKRRKPTRQPSGSHFPVPALSRRSRSDITIGEPAHSITGSSPALLSPSRTRKANSALPTRQARSSTNPNESLLLDILDNPRDTGFLRHFLISEFIDELLDFYLSVDEWRAKWLRYSEGDSPRKQRKIRQDAVDLYVWYLRDGAPRRVNIPSGVKDKIDEIFEPVQDHIDTCLRNANASSPPEGSLLGFADTDKPSSTLVQIKFPRDFPLLFRLEFAEDMFDEAQRTVLEMILIEPFVRFVESDDFLLMQEDRKKRPIKSSQLTRRKKLKANRPLKFADLTDNPDLYKVFENLLKKEFSEEYLHFWAKLMLFCNTKGGDSIVSQAYSIYERYIAGERVTVSITECENLKARLDANDADRHMFDLVRWEIEAILKTKFFDCFSSIQAEMKKIKPV